MGRDERVHEGLEVGAPPLGKAVADVPVARRLAVSQAADGGQALVKPRLEALDLVVLRAQVISRELEEGVCDLKHQDVGVVVLVADEDALAGASHAMLVVVLLKAVKSSDHAGVLLRLGLLDAECVVGQGVESDCLRLVRFEGARDDGWLRRAHLTGGDGRHDGDVQ